MKSRSIIISSTLPRLISGHPWACIISSLLLAAAFVPFIFSVKTVDNIDYFTLEDDPGTHFYENFRHVFGNDEFFIVAFQAKEGFTAKTLALLREITEELEGIEEVERVTSLANVDDTVGGPDYFEVKAFLQEIPSSSAEIERLRNEATENPLYVRNFISPDAKTLAIVVEAYEQKDDQGYRKRLIAKTRAILDKYRDSVDEFHLAGWTITDLRLGEYLKADLKVFVPATYILVVLIVLFVYRSITLTLLAFVNITLCVACTGGMMGMTGVTLNNVSCIVIPLVMALALCDTVHIFSNLQSRVLEEFPDKQEALAYVLTKVISPCFLTTVTTAVGFLSLAVSEIPPIKQFAWIASAGMFFEFIFSFFLVPPLILLSKPQNVYRERRNNTAIRSFIAGLHGFVRAYNRRLAATAIIVILGSCWFASRICVETNLVEFFKKSSPVRTSIDFVENHLAGLATADISLKAFERDAFKDPKNLLFIERLEKEIASIEGVDKTISMVDFIKDMNKSFHDEDQRYYAIPESKNLVSQYLLLYDSVQIEDVVNSEYDHARIFLRLSKHSSAAQAKIIEKIKSRLEEIDHGGIDIRVTGRAVNDVNIIAALVRGQVYSLSTAALVVGMIMFASLKSVSIGALSFIPNMFPIVLNFGIMGAAGISLDTGTALIATVALGIAVDDTIHFLSEYISLRKTGMSLDQALEAVFSNKGEAILSTSVILCLGFGVLVFSRFGPIVHFGLLTSLIMFTAFVGDMIVLPSVMLIGRQKKLKGSKAMDAPQSSARSVALR